MTRDELSKQLDEFLANGGKVQENYVKPTPISDKGKYDNAEFSAWYFSQRKTDKELAKVLDLGISCMRSYAYGRRRIPSKIMLKFKQLGLK